MKKRFIACVLACAMLLMGTGFAYWTDLINLKATANTGYLDVNFTAAEKKGNNWVPIEGSGVTTEAAYHSDTSPAAVITDTDHVDLSLYNLYPGHYQMYSATVANSGTVAAKLGAIKMAIGGDSTVAQDMIGVRLTASSTYTTEASQGDPIYGPDKNNVITERCYNYLFCHEHFAHDWVVTGFLTGYYAGKKYGTQIIGYETIPGQTTTNPVAINFPAEQTFTIDGVTFVRLSALSNVKVDVDKAITNILYLTNNSTMKFDVTIGMDPDAEGLYTSGSAFLNNPNGKSDSASQSKQAWIDFSLVWDQYNATKPPVTPAN